jgi:chromosome segregation ATPase
MSGSNAIAAAKRRRGGTEINKPYQPQNRNQSQNNAQSLPPSQIHPLQLVMINHERLNKLYNDFNELPQAMDHLGENFNSLSSNCDFLHEKLEGIESKLSTLNVSNPDTTGKNVNVELNSRIDLVEVRVNDLFKQFATLQSYMLELTLAVNNCKNTIYNMNSRLEEQNQTIHNMVESTLNENINKGGNNDVNQSQPNSNFDNVVIDTVDVNNNDTILYKEDLQSINYIV